MPPRYLLIPEPIDLGVAIGARASFCYSFATGLAFLIDHAPEFSRPASAVRAGVRLMSACELASPGEFVELRKDDWDILTTAVEHGATPWGLWEQQARDAAGVLVGTTPMQLPPRLFLPWANAIAEAKVDRPIPT